MATSKKVSGVDLDVAKAAVVRATAAKLGIVPGDLTVEVARIATYYRTHTPKARLADCLKCHGVADVQLEVCPYCGDGVEDEVQQTPPPHDEPSPPLALSERHLDAAVQRIHALKGESAGSLWELGSEIKRIHDTKLWTQRKNDKGAPKWRAWGSFTEHELGIGPAYAYKLMDVAAVYSRDQVRTIGVTKLHVTLQVPKEHRDRLLSAAQMGASARELSAAASDIGKVKRDTGRTGKGGAGAQKGRPKGRKADKVTVAALIGRVEIPLYKGASDKRARALTDTPRGTERLLNGVAQVFVVTKDEEGQWLLVVERVRE